MSDHEMLYCVGCGAGIAAAVPGQTLAIACACGALAPILFDGDQQTVALPFSVVKGFQASIEQDHEPDIGHLEYYLGYSYHQSTLKDQITKDLKAAGAYSQMECRLDKCRVQYWMEIQKQRYIRDNRLADCLAAVADTMKALQDRVIEVEGELPEGWPADPYEATRQLIQMLRGEEDPPPRINLPEGNPSG